MKCPNCGYENRANFKFCKKCGNDLTLPPAWFPTWKWHLKTLSWIYLILIAVFFIASYFLRKLPPPYHIRKIPDEMTPWLHPHKVPPP
ncbi:MAG: zinc ribbon domain-containing protein [Elusimicrobia bacterium]|nr:zinc ribbon domain-containing protein [Elusimicrobiota bacterium]